LVPSQNLPCPLWCRHTRSAKTAATPVASFTAVAQCKDVACLTLFAIQTAMSVGVAASTLLWRGVAENQTRP